VLFFLYQGGYMSVVVAIKKDGVVYMGADTQVTYGSYSRHYEYDEEHKLFIVKSIGIMIGFVGSASHSYLFKQLIKTLTTLKDRKLTKDIIRQQLVEPFITLLKDYDLLHMDEGWHDIKTTILIAKDDDLFQIEDDGNILNLQKYGSIGSGSMATIPYLSHHHGDIRNVIKDALESAAHMDQYVSAPFLICDSQTLELEEVSLC